MAYFGGAGVQGALHPSLRAYIDCFASPPFPKQWPRGGGVWDQDPILVRDFRAIRSFEIEWKNAQHEISQHQEGIGSGTEEVDLASSLDEYIASLEEEDSF